MLLVCLACIDRQVWRVQVAGYAGLLLSTPTVLYEIVAWIFPGLTREEQKKLGPIIFGSSILFFLGYGNPLGSATAVMIPL